MENFMKYIFNTACSIAIFSFVLFGNDLFRKFCCKKRIVWDTLGRWKNCIKI